MKSAVISYRILLDIVAGSFSPRADQSIYRCIEAGTLLEGVRSVYSIVIVLYFDIWREFFGGVPTSTTILYWTGNGINPVCFVGNLQQLSGKGLLIHNGKSMVGC